MAIRDIFKIAIKRGVRRTNPASELKRAKVQPKDLSSRLPSKQLFVRWVEAIRAGRSRRAKHCANLVEFLAYTGVRLGEAKSIEWRHVDLERGTILVEGVPDLGTKNNQFRRIDLIPAARELVARLREGISAKKVSEALGVFYPRVVKLMDANFRKTGQLKSSRYHFK